MIAILKENLWSQFGASIDMLYNAIQLWPDEYWHSDRKFFYNAYHCLVFLDYYLTVPAKSFTSPLAFTLTQLADAPPEAIDDIMPNRIYNKNEMLDYLQASRNKCYQLIASLTAEKLQERWVEVDDDRNFAVLEILLYNMRHVQHHAAQLNMLLRQKINAAPAWISRAK